MASKIQPKYPFCKKNILSLDIASRTGYAYYGSGRISSGAADFHIRTKSTKTIEKDHPGKRFQDYSDWLKKMIQDVAKPDLIVYEMIVGGTAAGGQTALVQKGLEAMTLAVAYKFDIPVVAIAAATIKKWATGSGALSMVGKGEMCSMALRSFDDQLWITHKQSDKKPWSIDDNQVDAIWLLDLACIITAFNPDYGQDDVTSLAHRAIKGKYGN